jgi:hypothetical protein
VLVLYACCGANGRDFSLGAGKNPRHRDGTTLPAIVDRRNPAQGETSRGAVYEATVRIDCRTAMALHRRVTAVRLKEKGSLLANERATLADWFAETVFVDHDTIESEPNTSLPWLKEVA